ncbi:hypothetical protein [Nocardia sp. NPDC005366]
MGTGATPDRGAGFVPGFGQVPLYPIRRPGAVEWLYDVKGTE